MDAPENVIAQYQPAHLTAGISPIINGLTIRQAKFVEHFIKTQNATESVAYAYGYEDRNVCASSGAKLLRLGKIKEAIQQRMGLHIASSDEVLRRLTIHARGDLTDVLEPDGSFNLRKARKRGASQLLKKMKKRTTYTKAGDTVVEHEYEIHDPQAALEKLGRFHKLFTDRVETEISEGDVDRITSGFIERLMELRTAQVTDGPDGPTTD
jgi:hypothetical protein